MSALKNKIAEEIYQSGDLRSQMILTFDFVLCCIFQDCNNERVLLLGSEKIKHSKLFVFLISVVLLST